MCEEGREGGRGEGGVHMRFTLRVHDTSLATTP